MESLSGLGEDAVVAQHWGVLALLADQIVSDDSDADASWADVLLCTSVDDAVLGPVDLLGAEVR